MRSSYCAGLVLETTVDSSRSYCSLFGLLFENLNDGLRFAEG